MILEHLSSQLRCAIAIKVRNLPIEAKIGRLSASFGLNWPLWAHIHWKRPTFGLNWPQIAQMRPTGNSVPHVMSLSQSEAGRNEAD